MTFVVEDGTGLSTATSYISVEDAKSYLDRFGKVYVGFSDLEFQAALNIATLALDSTYRMAWKDNGYRTESDQALDWPRTYAYYQTDEILINKNIVPVEIQMGTAFLALHSLNGNSLQPTFSNSSGAIKQYEVETGPIKKSITYMDNESPNRDRDTFTDVDDAMSKLVGSTSPSSYLSIERV